ncbi:hypothetical protein FOZ62_013735 [Perkinsus olseni]|nr:hypothetical protein FOZ62_013735 [Perkinsus olseni]
MLKEYPGFKFRWNPAPGDDLFDINSFGYVHTSIPAITSAHHPDGTKSNTGRQYIEGAADRNGMNLFDIQAQINRVKDGWEFDVVFEANRRSLKGHVAGVYHIAPASFKYPQKRCVPVGI